MPLYEQTLLTKTLIYNYFRLKHSQYNQSETAAKTRQPLSPPPFAGEIAIYDAGLRPAALMQIDDALRGQAAHADRRFVIEPRHVRAEQGARRRLQRALPREWFDFN